MKQSHAAVKGSQPTPAQLKEFFSQVDAGKITKSNLQAFLSNPKISEAEPSRSSLAIFAKAMKRVGEYLLNALKNEVFIFSTRQSKWSIDLVVDGACTTHLLTLSPSQSFSSMFHG